MGVHVLKGGADPRLGKAGGEIKAQGVLVQLQRGGLLAVALVEAMLATRR